MVFKQKYLSFVRFTHSKPISLVKTLSAPLHDYISPLIIARLNNGGRELYTQIVKNHQNLKNYVPQKFTPPSISDGNLSQKDKAFSHEYKEVNFKMPESTTVQNAKALPDFKIPLFYTDPHKVLSDYTALLSSEEKREFFDALAKQAYVQENLHPVHLQDASGAMHGPDQLYYGLLCRQLAITPLVDKDGNKLFILPNAGPQQKDYLKPTIKTPDLVVARHINGKNEYMAGDNWTPQQSNLTLKGLNISLKIVHDKISKYQSLSDTGETVIIINTVKLSSDQVTLLKNYLKDYLSADYYNNIIFTKDVLPNEGQFSACIDEEIEKLTSDFTAALKQLPELSHVNWTGDASVADVATLKNVMDILVLDFLAGKHNIVSAYFGSLSNLTLVEREGLLSKVTFEVAKQVSDSMSMRARYKTTDEQAFEKYGYDEEVTRLSAIDPEPVNNKLSNPLTMEKKMEIEMSKAETLARKKENKQKKEYTDFDDVD